ncbi:unnamed protein product [Diamesa hyperborea]
MNKLKKRKLYTRIEDEDDELNEEADKIKQITEVLSTSCNSVLIQVSKDYDRNQIYEIAINKYLKLSEEDVKLKKLKILYIGPSKSNVTEKCREWQNKFNSSFIKHLLADEIDELKLIPEAENVLIYATATKWEALTRNWRSHIDTVLSIKLVLIEDGHLLNDTYRGAALEVVMSRMKIINNELNINSEIQVRFLCFSALIPNIDDIVKWMESKDKTTVELFTINECFLPTKVDKSVLGYNSIKMTYFRFDLSLNYKLVNVIKQNSRNKPTLVFCSSRKSIELLMAVLENSLTQLFGQNGHGKNFHEIAIKIRDEKLRKLLMKGMAFYHGGLSMEDRALLEKTFTAGLLPILVSTTLLATETNVPAYLVIIKSTQVYRNGANEEYDDNTIHQMMSRAGCPNFDNAGRVIIMTQDENVDKYRKLIANNLAVESNLHIHLTEHLNTEIVLKTITNVATAIEWISSTFLYVRLHKNPKTYGLTMESMEEIDEKLKDIVSNFFKELEVNRLLIKDAEGIVSATNAGILMAQKCLSLKSMQTFQQLCGNESVGDLLNLLCNCQEFKEFSFRANDKKLLNELNQNLAKGLRYPMQGRIKSINMKISCLIQASLGNVPINDFTLEQEQEKILVTARWLCQCLFEFILTLEKDDGHYRALLSVVTLRKCLEANLWENSRLVIKQVGDIGWKEADTLAAAGLNSWDKVADYENLLTEIPSFFTNDLKEFVLKLPKYSIETLKIRKDLRLNVKLKQLNDSWQQKDVKDDLILIVGDSKNKLLMFNDKLNQHLTRESEFKDCITCKSDSSVIFINIVHSSFVGLDLMETVKMEESPVKEEAKMPITVAKGNKIKTLSVPSNNTSIKDYFEVIHHLPKMDSSLKPELKHEIVEILEPSNEQKLEIITENKKETVDAFLTNVKKRLSFFEAPMKAKLPKTTEIVVPDVIEKIEIPETQSSCSVNSTVFIEESPKSAPAINHFNAQDADQVIHSQLKQELIVNEDFRDLDTDQQLEVWNYLKPSFVKKQKNKAMIDSTLFKMKFNRVNNVLQLYQKKKAIPVKKIVKVSPERRIKSLPKPLIPMTPTICDDPKTPEKQSAVVCESFKTPVTISNEALIEMIPKTDLKENIILNDIFDSYVKEVSMLDVESHGNVSDIKSFMEQYLKTNNSQLIDNDIIYVSSQNKKEAPVKINLVDDNFAKDFLASMDEDEKIVKSSTQLNGIFANTPSLSDTARKIKKSQLMLTGLKVCENIVIKILDQNDEVTKEADGHLDFLFEQSLKPPEENISKDQDKPTNRRINFKDEIKENLGSSSANIQLNISKPKAKVPSTSRAIGELQLLHEKFQLTRNTQLNTSHDLSDTLFNSSGSGQRKLQLHQNNIPIKEMTDIKIKDDDRQAKLNICKQKLKTHNDVGSYLNDFIRVKFSDGS